MSYQCNFCKKIANKQATPELREAAHAALKRYGYAQLYDHIQDEHGYYKDETTGKLKKMKLDQWMD